jgi:phage shock protein E
VVLDARSDDKYQLLHVKGARHLSLPNFTEAELQKVIPNKGTRVLIYCNNNFENEPVAFASKVAKASLNIYTFNSLYSYGYTNVYELGPLLDIKKTKLQLAGTSAKELYSQENEGSAQK